MKTLYIWNFFFFINLSFLYDVFQITVDMHMFMELGAFGLALILKKNYFSLFVQTAYGQVLIRIRKHLEVNFLICMYMQGHVFKVYQIQTKSVDSMYTGSRAVFCDMVSKD